MTSFTGSTFVEADSSFRLQHQPSWLPPQKSEFWFRWCLLQTFNNSSILFVHTDLGADDGFWQFQFVISYCPVCFFSPFTVGGSEGKHLPAMQETCVQSLGREDPLEKEMATHSSILTWKIPWTEEPGRLQSMGSLRVGHDFTFTFSDLLHLGNKSL